MAALTERTDSPQRDCLQNARRHICFFQNKKAKSETLEEFAEGSSLRSSSPYQASLYDTLHPDTISSPFSSPCSEVCCFLMKERSSLFSSLSNDFLSKERSGRFMCQTTHAPAYGSSDVVISLIRYAKRYVVILRHLTDVLLPC